MAEIETFLKFFSSQRSVLVAEVEAEFEDTKETRLLDEMYSKDDVIDILNSLKGAVGDEARRGLEKTANMAAIVLEQALSQAERGGVDVSLDFSRTEDEGLLADISKLKGSSLTSSPVKKPLKLESIADEHQRLIQKVAMLEEENEKLTNRYQEVQAQYVDSRKKETALKVELDSARKELSQVSNSAAAAEEDLGAAKANLSSINMALKEELNAVVAQLEEAKSAQAEMSSQMETRVTQTKQYQQLKNMLKTKNQQLIDLRKRIRKYEPDEPDVIDD